MLLSDFIETPSQNCSPEELKAGVELAVRAINENSEQIVAILRDSYTPATFILHDLVEKLALQNCQHQFAPLYDKHLDELVTLSVWSWHDLQRFIENQPNYLEKIMVSVSHNDACMQRLFNDTSHAEEIINHLHGQHPEYEFQGRFAELVLPKTSFRPS